MQGGLGYPPAYNRVYVKIPLDRIGALIGGKGIVKRELEERTNTIVTVDSKNGIVIIEPASPDTPFENILKAREVVRAIAVGFSPERAFRLLDEDQVLVTIDLKEYFTSPNHITRVKARIIGEKGKTRRIIEETTGTYVNIGDTVIGIIGDYEQANIAREAIEMLINGKSHATVYSFLERKSRGLKRRRMTDLWK